MNPRKGPGIVDHPLLYLALGVLAGLAIGWLLARVSRERHTRAARRDAVRRSQAVTAGKVFEQLVPWLPDFAYDPRDARFLGSPVDFIVFDGLSSGTVERVVFVEVKSGEAGLSTRERRVRDAIRDGRIEWAEHRVSLDR
jgi:predicted Holliday junction resolvase-like endonuclease